MHVWSFCATSAEQKKAEASEGPKEIPTGQESRPGHSKAADRTIADADAHEELVLNPPLMSRPQAREQVKKARALYNHGRSCRVWDLQPEHGNALEPETLCCGDSKHDNGAGLHEIHPVRLSVFVVKQKSAVKFWVVAGEFDVPTVAKDSQPGGFV